MSNQEEIKKLLEKFREDKTIIKELYSKYSINDILSIAIKNNMNDIIIALFQPVEIDGEYEVYFDYYSTIDTGAIDDESREYLQKMQDDIDIENPNIRSIKLKNSLPRQVSGWGHPVDSEKAVRYYAEPACLESMLYFYRNNITTTMNDTQCLKDEEEQGVCKVWIRYDTLSDENKEEIARLIEEGYAEFVENENYETVSIFVPCQKDETIGEVSDKLLAITKRLKKQISYRGFLRTEDVIKMLARFAKDNLYENKTIADTEERYLDLFFEYINEGLIKALDLSVIEQMDRGFELVFCEEETFSTVEFLKVIRELRPEIITELISELPSYYHIYYDEEEDRYWDSKESYERYLKEKREITTKISK